MPVYHGMITVLVSRINTVENIKDWVHLGGRIITAAEIRTVILEVFGASLSFPLVTLVMIMNTAMYQNALTIKVSGTLNPDQAEIILA